MGRDLDPGALARTSHDPLSYGSLNYLAHAALAEPGPHSLIGNLAGDHVKGPLDRHALHVDVATGVRRHRRVDGLTDGHPRFSELKTQFPLGQRRYAGIVLDVLFDHFLSADWQLLVGRDRDAFIDTAYVILDGHQHLVPEPFAAVLPRWIAADWLRVYETVEGVDAVMQRLAARMSRGEALYQTWTSVRADREGLRDGFREIFSDVRAALDVPPDS